MKAECRCARILEQIKEGDGIGPPPGCPVHGFDYVRAAPHKVVYDTEGWIDDEALKQRSADASNGGADEEGREGVDVRRVRQARDVAEGMGALRRNTVSGEQSDVGRADSPDVDVLGGMRGQGARESGSDVGRGTASATPTVRAVVRDWQHRRGLKIKPDVLADLIQKLEVAPCSASRTPGPCIGCLKEEADRAPNGFRCPDHGTRTASDHPDEYADDEYNAKHYLSGSNSFLRLRNLLEAVRESGRRSASAPAGGPDWKTFAMKEGERAAEIDRAWTKAYAALNEQLIAERGRETGSALRDAVVEAAVMWANVDYAKKEELPEAEKRLFAAVLELENAAGDCASPALDGAALENAMEKVDDAHHDEVVRLTTDAAGSSSLEQARLCIALIQWGEAMARFTMKKHVARGIDLEDVTGEDREIVADFYANACHAQWCEFDALMLEYVAARSRMNGAGTLELAKEKMDEVYGERDKCVSLIARMGIALGLDVGLAQHAADDEGWDPAWRTIVFVDLPGGQVSWHVRDTELPWFAGIGPYQRVWDGHSTEKKYERVLDPHVTPPKASFRLLQAAHRALQWAGGVKPWRADRVKEFPWYEELQRAHAASLGLEEDE